MSPLNLLSFRAKIEVYQSIICTWSIIDQVYTVQPRKLTRISCRALNPCERIN